MESIVMQVSGMHCGGCAQRIGTVLRRVEGVRDVQADHVSGRVEIQIGPELADRAMVADLTERIEAAGFQVVGEEVSS
ncbi:heavy-metal-associated domain-containing protein [Pseudonocardia sp. C8]|uniref:Heavy-metal-associated domain-containing protein n=1 Tax=Saccharopolyspora cebuensis TaxID=418759 RepID=A0ABV4CN24_9PSEU|nr:heavy-metal-associated domain-containing protein [Pseudonocardia sp. C8]MBC3193990.1 heavy-metal-associated domain-containing protein [Pseudonocardia sp. C8]